MTNHTLHLTAVGKQFRARVTYLQSKAERARPHSANMDIVSTEWIEQDWHPATLVIGDQSFSGRYFPAIYKLVEDDYT